MSLGHFASNRRQWLTGMSGLLPALALRRLGSGADDAPRLHHAPRARRIVWLFQSGGPSPFETLDDKPVLRQRHGQALPDSVLGGQRLTGMSGHQAILPMAGSFTRFQRCADTGIAISDLLPHTRAIARHLCVVRSLHTEAINHDPAITFLCTGSQLAGRPSMGAWLAHGIGSDAAGLPAFVVLVSKDAARDQPLYARLWGSGFLPAQHQGVQFRPGGEPVLFLADPPGIDRAVRSAQLEALAALHRIQAGKSADPSIAARTAQAELAFSMQLAIPQVADLGSEPASTYLLYGEGARQPGTYAANCVLARRLLERGVRFVQLFHQGWDQHGSLPGGITTQCQQTDQASAALVLDLQRRGLLDDTLVVWGGEFGRTAYCQGKLTAQDYGRDHHPRCFSYWLAGGGVREGHVHGATDDFGYNIASDPVHVHDLHATLLHLLGIDHERLTFRFQGRDYRLTDIAGHVVPGLLA
ncbi:MAG: DUF1501 domain-containing protein [Planctomycetes bacterium]|nr:DUF1501 domain-containing protein [Planctomycetota bacterium]